MYKQDWEQTTSTLTLQNDAVSLTLKFSDSSTFILPLYHEGHSFQFPFPTQTQGTKSLLPTEEQNSCCGINCS